MQNAINPVLLVVDMQVGFLGSKTNYLVPIVKQLVQEWTAAGGNTVFTRFISLPRGQYERLIGWQRLQQPPETDICPELLPFAHCVIEKNYYSAFTEAFKMMTEKQQWNVFAICGIATDSCVLKTAVDAFELGYTPYVLVDACGSHGGSSVHEAAITLLNRFIGKRQVTNIETFLSLHLKD